MICQLSCANAARFLFVVFATRPGELLLLGMRVAFDGGDRGKKVRGARLDTRNPWRKLAAKSVSLMREPELVGRDELADLVVPLGCIGVIRADPGVGGTRLLTEAIQRLDPGRVLLVTPVGASREPLGAVRRALSRSAVLHGAPALPEHLRDALDRLLAGEGTDRWSAAEIIDVKKLPRNGRAVFGTTVVLENAKSGEARTWRIVGETESDVNGGLISYKSPVGKAIIGHVEGDRLDAGCLRDDLEHCRHAPVQSPPYRCSCHGSP